MYHQICSYAAFSTLLQPNMLRCTGALTLKPLAGMEIISCILQFYYQLEIPAHWGRSLEFTSYNRYGAMRTEFITPRGLRRKLLLPSQTGHFRPEAVDWRWFLFNTLPWPCLDPKPFFKAFWEDFRGPLSEVPRPAQRPLWRIQKDTYPSPSLFL